MDSRNSVKLKIDGFTLIEVIVMISLGALIAAMVAPFVGTALTRSAEPLNRIIDAYQINGMIEEVSAEYQQLVSDKTSNLLHVFIGKIDAYGSEYQADGITVSYSYVDYRDKTTGALKDSDADGIYDPVDYGETSTQLLMVVVSKDDQSLKVLFGDQ